MNKLVSEYKIGDVVVCKTEFSHKHTVLFKKVKNVKFIVGNSYIIDRIEFNMNAGFAQMVYHIDSETGPFWFGVIHNRYGSVQRMDEGFYDFFYTKKEMRKMKLEAIDESR